MTSLKDLLQAICVKFHIYKITELRDQKIIMAMAFMVYVSAILAGYAMYINVDFLLRSSFIAFIIGICTCAFLILHDQSLLATDRKHQIYTKVFISLILAASFTLTNNADKNKESLTAEIYQSDSRKNSYVTAEMNEQIEKIHKEEMAIRKRIEEAGERINETKQPLIDARRSLKAFLETKEERIQNIRDSYKDKYVETTISDLDILVLQTKKFASGGEGTLIAFILAFLFFIIEALPAILRLMLDQGDYMTRYIASLLVVRDLRDQRISQQRNFASENSDIIRNLLYLEIIDKKSELVSNGFSNTEEMLLLDQRLKILNAGFHPYTGRSLDEIDLDFFSNDADPNPTPNNPKDTPPNNSDNGQYAHVNEEEAEQIFEF